MCGKPTALLSNHRGDVGIAPYANGKILPFNGARLSLSGVPSTPGPGCARSTLSKQERAGAPHPSRLTACHLPRRGRLPPGGALYPLLGEGGRAEGPDGCGAVPRTGPLPPLFRRCGGTFPQGKVRKHLPAGEKLPAENPPGSCGGSFRGRRKEGIGVTCCSGSS